MALVQDPTNPTGVTDTRQAKGGTGGAQRARTRKAYAALELKKQNYSWQEVAETLGFPDGKAALVAVEKALETGILSPESQELMRQMAGRRLEEWLYTLDGDARNAESPDRFTAIRESRGLLETHMKLFGYAAPQEVAIYNPLESEVQEFVSEMIRRRQNGKVLEESDIFDTDPDDETWELPAGRATVPGEVMPDTDDEDDVQSLNADAPDWEYAQPEPRPAPVTVDDVKDF